VGFAGGGAQETGGRGLRIGLTQPPGEIREVPTVGGEGMWRPSREERVEQGLRVLGSQVHPGGGVVGADRGEFRWPAHCVSSRCVLKLPL